MCVSYVCRLGMPIELASAGRAHRCGKSVQTIGATANVPSAAPSRQQRGRNAIAARGRRYQPRTAKTLELPGELKPVFETMLANATRICQAKFRVLWVGGRRLQIGCDTRLPPAHVEERRREPLIRPHPQDPLSCLARTKQVVHIADLREEEAGDATGAISNP